uniref:Uncharacterized protein n=1 Tax=Vespula pensylvanica TaxID=30213 RepID=A0A834JTM3_VESPE|nr:hypothetical protein H0235_016984 [Vespula pensylvanica]
MEELNGIIAGGETATNVERREGRYADDRNRVTLAKEVEHHLEVDEDARNEVTDLSYSHMEYELPRKASFRDPIDLLSCTEFAKRSKQRSKP